MEGILVELCPNKTYDIVDTRNNQYHRLRMYYDKLTTSLSVNMTVEFDVKVSAAGNAYAIFKSIVERNQSIFNTEDRSRWYVWGEDAEADFITHIVPDLHLDIRKNPEKESCSWAIDLIDYTNQKPADLKVQNTPFFTVGKYFYNGHRCNPAYSVTFNRKDYENYMNNYPNCDIYFWVHWTQLEYREINVPEIYGVWRGNFKRMAEMINNNSAPLHPYLHRKNDDHNAKDSYIFDLRDTSVFEHLL